MRMVLHQYSLTQRLVIQSNSDGSWLLTKEWRKFSDQPWTLGKGILLPNMNELPKKLGELLVTGKADFKVLDEPDETNPY